jgi:ketosteroid isomerase-like protein
MILSRRWAEQWVKNWNISNLEGLLSCYADDVELRSPFAKVFAIKSNGIIKGKDQLEEYWKEIIRRSPSHNFKLDDVYIGHMTIAFKYHEIGNRPVLENVIFNSSNLVTFETCCFYQP